MTKRAAILIAIILAGRAGWAGQAGQVSSLQGRVVRWGTNEPIGKVSVELHRGDNAPFVTKTAGDGIFSFPAVPAGQYRVVASRPGYVNAEYGQRWPNGAGTPLTLPAGQAVSNVPIPMLQTGAINGTIRDALGNPLGNVEVQALKASYQTGRRVLTRAQSVVSDDRGEYRLFWLTPGKYFIVARHPDLTMSPIRAGGISQTGGGGAVGPNGFVRVPRYQSFRTGGDNAASTRPSFEAPKNLKEKYMAVYYPNTTDETAAALIDVTPGGEARAIDFAVAPIPLHKVRGRVVSEATNEPAMSARVQWITSSGTSPDGDDEMMGPGQGALAVECCDGSFEISVPQGPITLVAAQDNLTARVALNVGDGDIDGVVLPVGRRFNLKGRVLVEGRTPSAADLGALRITLPIDPPVRGLVAGGYSNVLPDGTFTLPAGRGDFRLSIQPLLPATGVFNVPGPAAPSLNGAYIKSARLGNLDILNNRVHLDTDPQEPIEIVIGTATGAFDGRVVNRDRQPIPNVAVVVVPDPGRRSRLDLFRTTSADASGRFRFDRLPPGDYVVFALDGAAADGEWQSPEYLAAHESSGTPIKVAAATSLTAELTALTD